MISRDFYNLCEMRDFTDLHLQPSSTTLVCNFEGQNISLYVKREDLLHPEVSGNKFRKLKYNLLEAKAGKYDTLLSFGGAFSNHIAAVAAAGHLLGFNTIGVIRGEELEDDIHITLLKNPTLRYAVLKGMKLKFVSREDYRQKSTPGFIENLRAQLGNFFLLPEGGTNSLAVKGCAEILTEEDREFDHICCPVGTGGTIAGLINSSQDFQKILGFPALKGKFLNEEISAYTQNHNWKLITDYHFGGYGKVSAELINFINNFSIKYHIPLDPVYTGKMFFGIFDLVKKEAFPQNSRILAIHTGGLQGIEGMNLHLAKKKLPLIDTLYEK